WYRSGWTDHDAWLLVPIGFTIVAVVTYFGLMLMPTLRPPRPTAAEPAAEHPLRKYLLLPTDYGFQCWIFLLWGAPELFAWVYAAVFASCALLLAVALRKWWHELRAIDAEGRT